MMMIHMGVHLGMNELAVCLGTGDIGLDRISDFLVVEFAVLPLAAASRPVTELPKAVTNFRV